MSVDVRREGRVALIMVNRPEALNALSSAILEELHEELTAM
jgi:enoyl-CoA hydratase/carnithine racemase